MLVDALCARMVRNPESLDVVVASNLFGDILTDLAAALQGGMGMAASANIAPDQPGTPGLFEPVHGSAPGHRRARASRTRPAPCGARACCCATTGSPRRPTGCSRALEHVAANGPRTRDLGGSATTREVGDAIVAALSA